MKAATIDAALRKASKIPKWNQIASATQVSVQHQDANLQYQANFGIKATNASVLGRVAQDFGRGLRRPQKHLDLNGALAAIDARNQLPPAVAFTSSAAVGRVK